MHPWKEQEGAISKDSTDVFCLHCLQLSHNDELTGDGDVCPKCNEDGRLVWADTVTKDDMVQLGCTVPDGAQGEIP